MLTSVCISAEIPYLPSLEIKICLWTQVYLFLVRIAMSSGEGPNRLIPGGHYLTKHLIPYTPGEERSLAEAVRKTPSSPTKIILTLLKPNSFPTLVTSLIPRNVP